MNELKKFLNDHNINYDIGIINNDIYYKLSDSFENHRQ